jgi:hypothetical protein
MDDSTFDDLLRKKLKDYQDPTFDESALEDLHERMQGHTSPSWYANRSFQLAAIALIAITGINAYLFFNHSSQSSPVFTINQKKHRDIYTIDSLKRVISQMQCEAETRPVEIRREVIKPNFKLKLITTADYRADSMEQTTILKLGIGRINELPAHIYKKLKDKGVLSEENDEAFLNLSTGNEVLYQTDLRTSQNDLLVKETQAPMFRIVRGDTRTEEKKVIAPMKRQGESSLQAKNALEKHYYKGLGIQIAPHADLSASILSNGEGIPTPRLGIVADWIVSPRISFESGIDYSTIESEFKGSEVPVTDANSKFGTILSATYTDKYLSTPLAIKYRRWISEKSQLVWRTGFTPYWQVSRTDLCNYYREGYAPDSDRDRFSTLDKHEFFRSAGNTINTSLGLTLKREKNKGTWEASLFYEHNVGKFSDQSSIQLIGLRTAYWFKIK